MLAVSGSEIKEALSLSQGLRQGLEDMHAAAHDPETPIYKIASDFESSVGINAVQAIQDLRRLEAAIERGDNELISELDATVDAITDFLDSAISDVSCIDQDSERTKEALRHLQSWRRDAGRLSQYLCQMSEGPGA